MKTIGFYIIIWKMSTFEELNQNQIHKKPTLSQKISKFWLKYGDKIILAISIILIAGISLEAGFLKGQKNQKEPIVVNQPASDTCPKAEDSQNTGSTTNSPQQNNQTKTENQIAADNQKCAYVASKNSNKYHLPTCQWANKIKPENRICFSSVQEAQNREYQPAKCCIK